MIRFVVTLLAVAVTAEWTIRYSGLLSPTIHATVGNGVLVLATVLLFGLLTRVEDPQKFTQVYLLSIVAKIFLACVLIVILIFVDRVNARANVIFVFSLYVIFTVIEVLFLVRLRDARNGAKKNQKISF